MHETIETSVEVRLATIRFNRLKALNALNSKVLEEVLDATINMTQILPSVV